MLFIILLSLLSRVDSEWVEIAQNNYRRNSLKKVYVKPEFTTESYKIYPNLTLNAPDWHKGQVNRVSNVGNVRRVPFASVKTPALKIHSDNPTNRPKHEITESIESNTDDVTNKQEYYDIDIAGLKTKLNGENLKPNRRIKPEITADLNGLPAIDVDDEVIYADKDEWIYLSTKPTLVKNQAEIGYPYKANIKLASDNNRVNFKHFNSKPLTNSMSTVNINKSKDNNYRLHQIKQETGYELSKNNRKSNNRNPTLSLSTENDMKLNEPEELENFDVHLNLNKVAQDLIETSKKPNEVSLNTTITDLSKTKDFKIDIKNTLTKKHTLEESFNSQETDDDKLNIEKTKEDHLNGMWRMIKIITDIISKNTQRSVKSKIKYLEDLKNSILHTIEDRINRAWPDDQNFQGQEHTRAARSAHEYGHVELPSSEGALMTISFLTFAVFLIKLVLQIIHSYKNKTMMMTPAVVAAVGRAAAALRTKK